MNLSPEQVAALRKAGLGVSQHRYMPRPDEWFAGSVSGEGRIHGEVGPFPSAEEALIGGIRWMVRLLDENTDRAERAEDEVQSLGAALRAAQAELRAEREAKAEAKTEGAPSQVTSTVPPPRAFHGAYAPMPASFDPELVWVLMRRAGLFIAEQDGAWQWMVEPPSRTGYLIRREQPLWYGPYQNAPAALAGALAALIGFAEEDHESNL